MSETYYKEIEPNYFVYGGTGLDAEKVASVELYNTLTSRLVDEFIQLPYKKIRIRHPDTAYIHYYWNVFYNEIPKVDKIITISGKIIPYIGEYYGSGRRVRSLFMFLNSLYGSEFATPLMPRKGYGFVIEKSEAYNGYDVITAYGRIAAKRWKERSNFNDSENEERTNKVHSVTVSHRHFNRLTNGKFSLLDNCGVINNNSDAPLFWIYRDRRYKVYDLLHFLQVLVENIKECNNISEMDYWFFHKKDIFIALCEYYHTYFEKRGLKITKRRFREMLRLFCGVHATKDTQILAVNSLLSYIIELTSKYIIKNGK